MENSNHSTPSTEATVMSDIQSIFNDFISSGGDPKVTAFKRHLDKLINQEIKPLCGRSAKSADGNDWRSLLKAKFSGKGAKWVIVPLAEISSTITQLEADGVDCNNYKTFTELKGAAWIRFSGPRLDSNGKQAAAFEVRTEGSTIDHPKQLHMIPVDVLDETIRPMNGTPHSLKFEVIAQPKAEEETPADEPEIEETPIETVDELSEDLTDEDYEDVMGDIEDLMALEDEDL